MPKGEESKALPQVLEYIKDGVSVLDIGCNTAKVVPWAFGIDMINTNEVDMIINPADIYFLHRSTKLERLEPMGWDVVFSSHVLEHLCNWRLAFHSWFQLVKKGGYLILYLPDGKRYDNLMNKAHVQDFTRDGFTGEVLSLLMANAEIVKNIIEPAPGYSFLMVIKKL
jgi:SAM-dependent methyltransferase